MPRPTSIAYLATAAATLVFASLQPGTVVQAEQHAVQLTQALLSAEPGATAAAANRPPAKAGGTR